MHLHASLTLSHLLCIDLSVNNKNYYRIEIHYCYRWCVHEAYKMVRYTQSYGFNPFLSRHLCTIYTLYINMYGADIHAEHTNVCLSESHFGYGCTIFRLNFFKIWNINSPDNQMNDTQCGRALLFFGNVESHWYKLVGIRAVLWRLARIYWQSACSLIHRPS